MIPVNVTLQFMRDNTKDSANIRLSMDMTVQEAILNVVRSLNLASDSNYHLVHQREILDGRMKLFEAGVQEGEILQLTVLDSNSTININMGNSRVGNILNRLGGKAGDEPLPIRAALITPDGMGIALRHTRALVGRADEKLGYPPEALDAELTALDPNRTVSRPHAMIVYADGVFTIRDLYSQHGVQINGERLSPSQAQPIHDGDVLTFGDVALQFRCEG